MHLSSTKLDQLTELVRLLPFLIALVLFLTGQGRRGKRRPARPAARPTRMAPPVSWPDTNETPAATRADEPSIWAKDDDTEDQWGLSKEEWGDAFGEKWKSAFDDPAPPAKQ